MITDKQWEELRQLGCKVPPYSLTKVSATRLLAFIRQGNGTFGASPAERAKIALSYRTKYIGKRVRGINGSIDEGRSGTVTDLRARFVDEVVSIRRKCTVPGATFNVEKISPFEASVRWDATNTFPEKYNPGFGTSLYYLELIGESEGQHAHEVEGELVSF